MHGKGWNLRPASLHLPTKWVVNKDMFSNQHVIGLLNLQQQLAEMMTSNNQNSMMNLSPLSLNPLLLSLNLQALFQNQLPSSAPSPDDQTSLKETPLFLWVSYFLVLLLYLEHRVQNTLPSLPILVDAPPVVYLPCAVAVDCVVWSPSLDSRLLTRSVV